jgi:hypothetical protein
MDTNKSTPVPESLRSSYTINFSPLLTITLPHEVPFPSAIPLSTPRFGLGLGFGIGVELKAGLEGTP